MIREKCCLIISLIFYSYKNKTSELSYSCTFSTITMWKGLYLYYALSKNNLSIRKLSLPGATSFVELKTFKAADSS